MPRSLPPIIALIALAAPAFAKKPFAIGDLYRVKSISGLSLSPDGAKLLFQVSTPDFNKGSRLSQIWMKELATGKERQLTFSDKSSSSPAWAADGKSFTFMSYRDGSSQIYRMDMEGGEAVKLASFGPGVDSPRLLPDNRVAFTSSVYPETLADEAKHQDLAGKLEGGKVQAYCADELLYRHWTEYRSFQYNHLFLASTLNGKAEAITSGRQDFPSRNSSGGTYNFDVSPDGKELCTTANFEKELSLSTNHDLCLINLAGDKKPVKITENKAFDGDPIYSPDGRFIAFKTQKRPGFEADCFRLALYDRQTKAIRVVTEQIDNWVKSFQWSRDGKQLWFTIEEKARTPLFRYDVSANSLHRMMEGHAIGEYVVTPDQKSVLLSKTRIGEPGEIWKYTFEGGKLDCLTTFNKAISEEVDFRPGEEMWIPGAGGKPIHTWIIKPHGFDPAKKYPLIVNVHGGPQSAWIDTLRGDWQVYPGAGYIVAMPNPHGSTGFGQAFTDAISGDWDGKVMEDIDKVTEHLAGLPYVDSKRMGAMGWSWGGYAMMWMEGHNRHFKALAAMMGIYNLASFYGATEELWFPHWDFKGAPWENPELYARMSPSSYVKNFKTPCLVITGERDYRVPYTESLQFFTALQRMGVPSRLIQFKNDGHWPNADKSMPVYYNAHLEWFEKYLGGGKAPWSTEDMIRNLESHTDK